MPRLQKALKPDAGLEGLDLRGRGRKREGLAAWEETRLAANLNDFPSVLTSSPIISSQLFLASCEETEGGWARRDQQTGNHEAGLRDHALGSGKPLEGFRPLTGCPLPQLSDGRAASDDSTCPCLVYLPRVSESHSVVTHVIPPTSFPWCLLPLGAGITGLHQLRTYDLNWGQSGLVQRTRQSNNWAKEWMTGRKKQ